MEPNILVILTHPNLKESKNNKALQAAIADLPNVRVHALHDAYPNGKIDVAAEQAMLKEADLVVLQFPFYWYSSPPMLKAWEDQVLAYGFAFGPNGDKLKGKDLMVAITTYGPAEAYSPTGFNHFTLETLLTPFQQTANFCSMNYKPHFAVNGVTQLTDEQLKEKAAEYRNILAHYKRKE